MPNWHPFVIKKISERLPTQLVLSLQCLPAKDHVPEVVQRLLAYIVTCARSPNDGVQEIGKPNNTKYHNLFIPCLWYFIIESLIFSWAYCFLFTWKISHLKISQTLGFENYSKTKSDKVFTQSSYVRQTHASKELVQPRGAVWQRHDIDTRDTCDTCRKCVLPSPWSNPSTWF